MDDPYIPQGVMSLSGSAPLVGPAPGTTQQLNVDNSECVTMRAVVGTALSQGTVQPLQ